MRPTICLPAGCAGRSYPQVWHRRVVPAGGRPAAALRPRRGTFPARRDPVGEHPPPYVAATGGRDELAISWSGDPGDFVSAPATVGQ
jgi:hypothetical protein